MSKSRPTAKNPSTRFIDWHGGEDATDRLTYWDKEQETSIGVPLPFSFLVLDELHTVTGFNDAQHSGYWANEVKDLKNDIIVVRTKQGIQAKGTYDQIKALNLNGLKYAKSVYVGYYDDANELAIGNIKLAGAALTAWIEFNKRFNVEQCAVQLLKADGPYKKGSTTYYVPVFDGRAVSPETDKRWVELDRELQTYLDVYLHQDPDTTELKREESVDAPDVEEVETVTPPAEEPKQPEKKQDDQPIDLSDVPF